MITNPVLETKYKTQRQLDEEAKHDVTKYVENSHKITLEVEKYYGFEFKYGSPQGEGGEGREDQPKSA
ncbi:MAG: hypothetical protein OEU26_16480 [Candidatus Tectomicrobia bacterium]|nr:hypothetical protein [Candidatus Tectomicrobia bacterium]